MKSGNSVTAYLHPSLRTPLAQNVQLFSFVNTFVRTLLSLLSEEDNETATISNFLHPFTLHVTTKFSFNLLEKIRLKIKNKTSVEAQSEVMH